MTTQNKAVAKKDEALPKKETVQAVLEKMKPQFAMVLPRHLTPERLVRVALTALQQTPKLMQCDRKSLYSAIMRSAQLGLEPDGVLGQAYLIPYGKQVQFIVGYKGLIDLARRSGDVSNIIAKEVCENDEFEIAWHEPVPFRHEQPKSGQRGEVIGFWALARFKDGGFHWDYMTVDEIMAVRDQSSGWQAAVRYKKTADSPWQKHFNEMAKKTVIRRIAKYLPMSVQRAAIAEDLVDAGKSFSVDEYGDVIIDGESQPVESGGNDNPEDNRKKLDHFADDDEQEPAHDHETGEIIEGEQSADDTEESEPYVVPVKAIPGNATQNDWPLFLDEWSKAVKSMKTIQSLRVLKEKNDKTLGRLQSINPDYYEKVTNLYAKRMVDLGGEDQEQVA